MTITYRLGFWEHYLAVREQTRARSAAAGLPFGLLTGLIAVFMGAFVVLNTSRPVLLARPSLVLYPVGVCLTIFVGVAESAYLISTFMARRSRFQGQGVLHSISFLEDGIHARSGPVEGHYRWDAVQGVRETRRNVFFVVNNQWTLIPKRAFGSRGEMREAVDFALARLGWSGSVETPPELMSQEGPTVAAGSPYAPPTAQTEAPGATQARPPAPERGEDILARANVRLETANFAKMRALLIWHSPVLAAFYLLVLVSLCATALVHWWFPLMFLGVFAGLMVWSSWLQTRRQRALLRRSRLTYDVTRQELRILMPHQQSRLPWEAFWKTVETRDFFLLFISRQRVVLLPKADFERPEEVGVVRRLLAGLSEGRVAGGEKPTVPPDATGTG